MNYLGIDPKILDLIIEFSSRGATIQAHGEHGIAILSQEGSSPGGPIELCVALKALKGCKVLFFSPEGRFIGQVSMHKEGHIGLVQGTPLKNHLEAGSNPMTQDGRDIVLTALALGTILPELRHQESLGLLINSLIQEVGHRYGVEVIYMDEHGNPESTHKPRSH